jgi:hypothetical protein
MNVYQINWLDEFMEPQGMTFKAESGEVAIQYWEEETLEDFCSEITSVEMVWGVSAED